MIRPRARRSKDNVVVVDLGVRSRKTVDVSSHASECLGHLVRKLNKSRELTQPGCKRDQCGWVRHLVALKHCP